MPPESIKSLRNIVYLISGVSILWALILGIDVAPWLRGDAGWRWPYAFPQEHPERLLWLAISLGGYCIGAWWLARCKSVRLSLIWSAIGTIWLTVAVLQVSTTRIQYELYTRTVSTLTTGWHSSAVDVAQSGGLNSVLKRWPDFVLEQYGRGTQHKSTHLVTSPPGLTILYSLTDLTLGINPDIARLLGAPLRTQQCQNLKLMRYTDAQLASAWLGILTPLWASLAVFPLYWLGKRLYENHAAVWGTLWWPLIPALLMFTPYPSTAYPVLSALSLALMVEGMHRRQMIWIAGSGLVASLMTFLNFSLLPFIFLQGVFTLAVFWLKHHEWDLKWHWPMIVGAWYGAGLISIWLVYYVLYHVPVWTILQATLAERGTLTRPYLPWVFLGLNDYGMFTGWPAVLLAVAAFVIVLRSFLTKQNSEAPTGLALTLAVPITFIVMAVSGTVRGETGRIWLFLSPFVLLIATYFVSQTDDDRPIAISLIAQAAMVLVMVSFVHVIDSGLKEAPSSPPQVGEVVSLTTFPTKIVFDKTLNLIQFAGKVTPNRSFDQASTLTLWLTWQSNGQIGKPYYLSLIPVAPDGAAAPSAILIQPFNDQYPMTCWQPDDGMIVEKLEVPLPASAAHGDWWISLSLVDGESGEKASVTLPDGAQDTQTGIGPFR